MKFIYCHNDGYVKTPGLGSVLVKHFDTERDVQKLIDIGDLSFLYDNISLDEAEELASRTSCAVEEINDCCAAFYIGRDSRSAQRFHLEDYVSPKSSFRKDAWDIEYFYLFADNEWYVSCAETEWNFEPVLTLMNMKESRSRRGHLIKESANNEMTAKKKLAKYLKCSPEDLIESDEYDYYNPDFEFAIKDGNKEKVFVIFKSEDSAYEAAVKDLEEQYRDDSTALGNAIDNYGTTIFDFIDFYEPDYDDEDEDEEHDDEDKFDFYSSVLDDIGGYQFASRLQSGDLGSFDARGFAKYVIDDLGPTWHIANYDGKEIDLGNGWVAYRQD